MKELVIDLESAPHRYDEYCQAFPDKVTTKKDGTKSTKKQPGLHALMSRTACVCVKPIDEPTITFMNADEKRILEDLYDYLGGGYKRIIGYNVYEFDICFLKLRSSLIYDIPMADVLPKDGRSAKLLDMFLALGGKWNMHASSLSEILWAARGCPKNSEGHEIAQMWSDGRYSDIASHCQEDVQDEEWLYKKLKGVYWI